MKRIQTALYAIVGILIFGTLHLQASSLIMGAVQFPSSVTKVPRMRIYCGGQIIPYESCDTEYEAKKFIFKIPKTRYQRTFHIFITESINFKAAKNRTKKEPQNTIKYLTVPAGQAYKLYKLKLVPTAPENEFDDDSKDQTYQWKIKEESIAEKKRKIPEDAIIVCYNPDWVDELRIENAFELPTIALKKNLLELAGTEQKLAEFSDTLLLASINSDTIHATMRQVIKQDMQRTTIAPPSA